MIGAEVISGGRRDLTHLGAFSIDDALTSEIDDALSVETAGDGRWRVGIHIADPGAFVSPGTDLDRLTESRAVTYYLPEGRVLMMPSRIAEDAAALLPGVDRPALSFFATLDETGALLESEIAPSIIRSRARVTYEEADASVLREQEGGAPGAAFTDGSAALPPSPGASRPAAPLDHDHRRERLDDPLPAWIESALVVLHRLALALEEGRIRDGAHIIRAPEVDLSVSPDGAITIKRLEGDAPGRLLVSEMMILTGRIAARFCLERGIPCIYRRQPPPEESFPAVRGGPYDPVAVRKARRGCGAARPGPPRRHHALGARRLCAGDLHPAVPTLAVHRQIKSSSRTRGSRHGASAEDRADRRSGGIARPPSAGATSTTLRYLEPQVGRKVDGVVAHRDARRRGRAVRRRSTPSRSPPRPDLEPGRRLTLMIESVNPRGPSIRLRPIDS